MLGVTAKLTELDQQRKNNAFKIFRPDPTRGQWFIQDFVVGGCVLVAGGAQ